MTRTVLITGGSRGIGYACAEALLKAGFAVHLAARGEAGLDAAAAALSPLGPVGTTALDLRDRDAIAAFAAGWSQPLHGLINNAGTWGEERLDGPDTGLWDHIMELNVSGLYFLTKALLPSIPGGGRILNISSQLGTSGRAGMGAYTASKHAVIGLTRCWALELGPAQTTVNAVCPGWVRTQSNIDEIQAWADEDGVTYDTRYRQLADPLTLTRFIEPAEVAALVAFLISDAGSGVTGQVYEIK